MRNLKRIKNLPISYLTDEEIVRATMSHLKSKCVILIYLDDNNKQWILDSSKTKIGNAFKKQILSLFKRYFV